MKNNRNVIYRLFPVFALVGLMSLFSSCRVVGTTKVKNAPPGQVKKATGSQSAKPYAPGQRKKKNKN
jgi:hypothetical protein